MKEFLFALGITSSYEDVANVDCVRESSHGYLQVTMSGYITCHLTHVANLGDFRDITCTIQRATIF